VLTRLTMTLLLLKFLVTVKIQKYGGILNNLVNYFIYKKALLGALFF
jgi:hypothetical protein